MTLSASLAGSLLQLRLILLAFGLALLPSRPLHSREVPTPTDAAAAPAEAVQRLASPPLPSPSPPLRVASGRIEESDGAAGFSGTWYPSAVSGNSAGMAVLATDPGARVTLTFSGRGVKWIGYRDEWSGMALVYVDGMPTGTVDTYASPARHQDVLFAVDGLSAGTHELEIEVVGEGSASSQGVWVWVDAFDVSP